MIEPEKPLKKKDQIPADEELAKRVNDELQAELEEEEERVRKEKEETTNLALIELWEDKQVMIEADRLLCERLQARERDGLSIEDKSKLFVELMNKRKKYFAELRAKEKRNKPSTKRENMNQISTYLKHMGNYIHSQLKSKNYEKIERLFEKEMKRVNTFILMDQDEERSKKDKSESKRVGKELESDVSKKQKVDEQVETDKHVEAKIDDSAELKSRLEIVPEDEDDVTVDATPLSSKSPSIVDYKIYKEGRKNYFQIIRADGTSKSYLTFGKMFKNFNREDVEDLWKIVKSRFKKTDHVNDMDNLLLHTLNTMFEPKVEDTIWTYQQESTVKNWKLYDSCGVYCITM
ncbi:hypothetical protein Tco_0140731 [Tanacetum coccineum]